MTSRLSPKRGVERAFRRGATLLVAATLATAWVTAGTPAEAALEVTSLVPPPDAVGVPPSATVQATFSEPLDPATVTTGSFSVARFLGFQQVAAGSYLTVALRTDGTVVGWGRNWYEATAVPEGLTDVVAVSASQHVLALRADGTVVAWGFDSSGQATVPEGLTGVVAVAAGARHSVALRADGTVVAWGSNEYGQASAPEGLNAVVAIAAGTSHTVALKADGTVLAWGSNDYGQTNAPADLTGVVGVAAGSYHTVALKADGTVAAWGDNQYGQATVPEELIGVVAVAAGKRHTVALKADGTVVAWGGNYYGQATVPEGLSEVVAVAAGEYHTLAVKRDGTAVGWGLNSYGETTVPAVLTGIAAVAAGQRHTVALGADGKVAAWGHDRWLPPEVPGDLGNWLQTEVPADLTDVVAISPASAAYHTLAVKADGTVVAWGPNSDAPQTTVPEGLRDVVAVAAGTAHSAALKADGTVVAWGAGQATVPPGLSGVVAVAAGSGHTVALKADGTVVAWGDNLYGQTEVPEGLTGVVAIDAGELYTVALKAEGTLVAWGAYSCDFAISERVWVPEGLTGVVAVAAGDTHGAALKADGRVVTWSGCCASCPECCRAAAVPEGLMGVVGIAAGGYHTVALRADGTVVAWGSNGSGESTVRSESPYGETVPGSISCLDDPYTCTFASSEPLAWGSFYDVILDGVRGPTGDPLLPPVHGRFRTSDAPAGAISGRVTADPGGAPVEGAAVAIGPGQEATTDADGSCLLAGVTPGSYTVSVTREDYLPAEQTVVVQPGDTATADFVLVRLGTISGAVTASIDGAPLAGATVSAVPGEHATVTDASGRYELAGLVPGEYVVKAAKAGYETGTRTVAVAPGQAVPADFALEVTLPGAIAGLVAAPGGAPILGAVVSTTTGGYSAQTDGSGRYTLSGVSGGEYVLTAAAAGYLSASASVTVVPGQTAALDFLLAPAPPGAVSGRVTGLGGAPLVGVTVSSTPGGYSTVTSWSGTYVLSGVPAGEYLITATTAGYVGASELVTVTAAETVTANFALVPAWGGISGRVTTNGGAPIARVRVATTTGGYSALTDGDGRYVIEDVLAGEYVLTASRPLYRAAKSPVTVTAGETVAADFSLVHRRRPRR